MAKGRSIAPLCLAVALLPRPAAAQIRPPEPRISWVADGIVTGAGLGVAWGASFIPVDRSRRWQSELLPFDCPSRGNFSASAGEWSNGLAMVTVVTPVALQAGAGIDDAGGRRLLIYGETLSATLALNSVTKYLVARPRPYVYSADPRVMRYADRQRNDSHLSFFSGHSAMTFAAAVSGSYLFTQTSPDRGARAAVWGTELFLAATTAGLRVRAGQHFPSDVLVGAVVGAGLGAGIPALHYAGRHPRGLSTGEWVAAGVGPIAGTLASALLPFPRDLVTRLDDEPKVGLVPWVTARGAGLALEGTL
jgi:membrane-associated phospholipid phosphatase